MYAATYFLLLEDCAPVRNVLPSAQGESRLIPGPKYLQPPLSHAELKYNRSPFVPAALAIP